MNKIVYFIIFLFSSSIILGQNSIDSLPTPPLSPPNYSYVEELVEEFIIPELKTYKNKDYNFSFQIPKDWKDSELQEGEVVAYMESLKSRFTLRVIPGKYELENNNFIEKQKNIYLSYFPKLNFIKSNKLETKYNSITQLYFNGFVNDLYGNFTANFIEGEKYLVLIVFYSDIRNSYESEKKLNLILNSFRFKHNK